MRELYISQIISNFMQKKETDYNFNQQQKRLEYALVLNSFLIVLSMMGWRVSSINDPLGSFWSGLLFLGLLSLEFYFGFSVKVIREKNQVESLDNEILTRHHYFRFITLLERDMFKIEDRDLLVKVRQDLSKGMKKVKEYHIEELIPAFNKYIEICELNFRYLHRYDQFMEEKNSPNKSAGDLFNEILATVQEVEALPDKYKLMPWVPEQLRDLLRETPNPEPALQQTRVHHEETPTYRPLIQTEKSSPAILPHMEVQTTRPSIAMQRQSEVKSPDEYEDHSKTIKPPNENTLTTQDISQNQGVDSKTIKPTIESPILSLPQIVNPFQEEEPIQDAIETPEEKQVKKSKITQQKRMLEAN